MIAVRDVASSFECADHVVVRFSASWVNRICSCILLTCFFVLRPKASFRNLRENCGSLISEPPFSPDCGTWKFDACIYAGPSLAVCTLCVLNQSRLTPCIYFDEGCIANTSRILAMHGHTTCQPRKCVSPARPLHSYLHFGPLLLARISCCASFFPAYTILGYVPFLCSISLLPLEARYAQDKRCLALFTR